MRGSVALPAGPEGAPSGIDGPVAAELDFLWWMMLVLGTATFVLFGALLLAGMLRSRDESAEPDGGSLDIDGDGAADEPPEEVSAGTARTWIIGGGVLLPVVVVGAVLVATILAMDDGLDDDPPPGAMVIEVIGHQWWWEVRYPDLGVVTANEVHFPAGEPVELRLTSADVIHSLWFPPLAGKRDLLPDGVTTLVLEADDPGRYQGHCAEFCGLQHTLMRVSAVVHSPEDFEAWVEEQRQPAAEPAGALEQRGQQLFVSEGCGRCHTVDGTEAAGGIGPDLTHVASRATIGAGTLPTTTDAFEDWISDPDAVKNGVLMPGTELTGDDLDALVAYVESLG